MNVLYVQLKSYEEERNNDSQELNMLRRRKCQKSWMWSTKNSQICNNMYVFEKQVLTHKWGKQLLS